MPQPEPSCSRRLTTPEAAGFCGCSASMLEKLRVAGTGPVYLKLGRRVVYDVIDLEAWLATRRRCSTSDAGSSVNQPPRASGAS